MSGLSSVIDAIRDPLVVICALFAVGIVAAHLLFRNYPFRRAVVRVVLLILLTIALLHADIVPYRPLQLTGTPFRDVVHAVLKIAWWLWGAWFLVGVLRASLVIEARPHEGRLLQDLIAGLIYLSALFAIIAYVLDLPIQGLLATSGVIAIILGLALQSTLGDVFSGIVLNLSRPYRPGDWISIEGSTDGRVIETNWRATHILTAKRDLAIVPNSTIAKSKIINVSSPSGIHGITVNIQTGTSAPPGVVAETLKRALLNCRLVLEVPAPSVAIKAMNATYLEFEVSFFVAELGLSTRAQNDLLDLTHRHLAAEGIVLAPPSDASLSVSAQAGEPSRTRLEQLLDRMTIFASLTPDERRALAPTLKPQSFEDGDILGEPGKVPQALYIVGQGVLSYSRDTGASEQELMRLGPGDHFGEIVLLTGAPVTVRIVALTPGTIYLLAEDDLRMLLQSHPDVSRALHRILVDRQTVIDPPVAVVSDPDLSSRRLKGRLSDWVHRRYAIAVAND